MDIKKLISGILSMQKDQEFSEELFKALLSNEDIIIRAQNIENARRNAKKIGRIREFNNLFKAHETALVQMETRNYNTTNFTGQKIELRCGEWIADSSGVRMEKTDRFGNTTVLVACNHPILPIQIMKNVETGEEYLTLAFYQYGKWQQTTIEKSVCSDNSMITKQLSRIGISVISDTARNLVKYIYDVLSLNQELLVPQKSTGRLGWHENDFVPYCGEYCFDGDNEFGAIFKNVTEYGDFDIWKNCCSELRKNKIVRLMFAASASSVLLERVNALPYIFHVWSNVSGSGKTVSLMAAASIWGNPQMGALLKSLNTTFANLIRTAAFFHNIPFFGDELQTMRDRYTSSFDSLVYQLCEGVERGRAKASGNGVEETRSWQCCFLFTGEEPLTKDNSRSGSKNRVIEISSTGKLIEHGNATVTILKENYGFAGRKIVEFLQETYASKIRKQYNDYFLELCKTGATDKQSSSMACVLLGDWVLTQVIFTDEEPLTVNDISVYLKNKNDVSISEQAYRVITGEISKNINQFYREDKKDSSCNTIGSIWGKIKFFKGQMIASVNSSIFRDILEKANLDYTASTKALGEDGFLIRGSGQRYIHRDSIQGVIGNYIWVKLPSKENDLVGKEFGPVDNLQCELPFK